MRRAGKVDANQGEIVAALRELGISVQILSAVGEGCPDILVGYKGGNYPIEIKDGERPPSERTLTPQQKKWHAEWKGTAYVANRLSDVLLIIGAARKASA